MIRYVIIIILFLISMSSYAIAQMGHGMMRGGHMMGEEHMKGMMNEGHMMDHGEMMNMMTEMTRDMTEMMQRMSEIMGRVQSMDKQRMHSIAEMMRDLASEMNRMSFMMERGDVTQEEMNDLQQRIGKINAKLRDIMKQ